MMTKTTILNRGKKSSTRRRSTYSTSLHQRPRTIGPVLEQTTTEQRQSIIDLLPQVRNGAECGYCEKMFAAASIAVIDKWKHDRPGGGWMIRVGLYCDHCNLVRTSIIQTLDDGTMIAIHEDSYTSDQKKIDDFIKKFPQARGIVDS